MFRSYEFVAQHINHFASWKTFFSLSSHRINIISCDMWCVNWGGKSLHYTPPQRTFISVFLLPTNDSSESHGLWQSEESTRVEEDEVEQAEREKRSLILFNGEILNLKLEIKPAKLLLGLEVSLSLCSVFFYLWHVLQAFSHGFNGSPSSSRKRYKIFDLWSALSLSSHKEK